MLEQVEGTTRQQGDLQLRLERMGATLESTTHRVEAKVHDFSTMLAETNSSIARRIDTVSEVTSNRTKQLSQALTQVSQHDNLHNDRLKESLSKCEERTSAEHTRLANVMHSLEIRLSSLEQGIPEPNQGVVKLALREDQPEQSALNTQGGYTTERADAEAALEQTLESGNLQEIYAAINQAEQSGQVSGEVLKEARGDSRTSLAAAF